MLEYNRTKVSGYNKITLHKHFNYLLMTQNETNWEWVFIGRMFSNVHRSKI